MPRYALKIEYDGAPFAGWQRQKTAPSVQATVEAALTRLEPDLPAIAAAGRTDAGVHATAQVVHCDMARDWDAFRLSEALNYHLKPAPIAILAAAKVDPGFHARFSALGRHYLYRLQSRRAPLTLDRGQVWRVNHRLDIAAMQTAAADLIGRHDFTTFRSTHCQARSPEKTLDRIDISATEIPHGTEQDRIRAFGDIQCFGRKRMTHRLVGRTTNETFLIADAVQPERIQHPARLHHDLRPDAVSCEHCNQLAHFHSETDRFCRGRLNGAPIG